MNKETLLTPLFKMLDNIAVLEHDIKTDLTNAFTIKTVKAQKHILKQGQVCTHLCFMTEGILRTYHNIEQKEITARFTFANNIVVSAGSFFMQTPATESIQAIEDCTFLEIPFIALQKIYKKYPLFNYHTRLITENYFYQQEQRLFMLRHKSAKAKFEYFNTHFPHYFKDIPIKYIASFLGISAETLSRIRNKH